MMMILGMKADRHLVHTLSERHRPDPGPGHKTKIRLIIGCHIDGLPTLFSKIR